MPIESGLKRSAPNASGSKQSAANVACKGLGLKGIDSDLPKDMLGCLTVLTNEPKQRQAAFHA